MASLTPQERSAEVVDQAFSDGMVTGGMVLAPALGALYLAMKNPKFRKLTNWQSRTALVIMPSLFAFAFVAEDKMVHRMREVADETEHSIRSVEWAEQQRVVRRSTQDVKLHDLYREAVLNSNVRLVEGEMTPFHKTANYVQSNPFKIIVGVGVPSVALIFWGRTTKEHLSMQLKILHTRVLGQFTIICTLLGVMGLKEVMDRQGRYITEEEVETRVAQMENTRRKLLARLDEQVESRSHLRHANDDN
mmetsp:Transcript_83886/g.125756  ORF Transcript_83886/g.125756 Transcript_83886/m.125756 type:complete len:248 (+) Transcript_83886:166-909(+)|eukprot:CAMPEP_0117035800 /NCGR_PEP_ID=MMETSP0472-20121206/25404_1 /TAXON_ID=693140 ORGANISM="Tiarina fusus, Strain LIS" /NCGR_SAMPLE_ID=MMETSP0472 /ASSEMBLY_ACC=CAM_ASM_000603 /LENGTH=247 /DNA_ID=CAMNT_0004745379 /DNA_START=165 /DNA_END=908 /DNA_ORIENTATION=+